MGAPNITSGTWSINDRIKGGYYKIGSSAGLIAIVGNGFNIGSAKNDAHQIAASGALYDALAYAEVALEGVEDTSPAAKMVLPRVRAALALARSEPTPDRRGMAGEAES